MEAELPPNLRGRAPAITRAVLAQLWIEVDPGETAKLIETMPAGLRGLWPEIARR